MPHHEARMTSKGQLTVPAAVRERLALQAGDIVDFYVDEVLGEVRVSARNKDVSDLFGSLNAMVGGSAHDHGDEALATAIGRYLAEKDRRIVREWREYEEFRAWRKRKSVRAAE